MGYTGTTRCHGDDHVAVMSMSHNHVQSMHVSIGAFSGVLPLFALEKYEATENDSNTARRPSLVAGRKKLLYSSFSPDHAVRR